MAETTGVSPALERMVRHCWRKIRRSGFNRRVMLRSLWGAFRAVPERMRRRVPDGNRRHGLPAPRWRWLSLVATMLLFVVLIVGLWPKHPTPAAEFVQLTNDSYVKNNDGWPPPVFDNPLLSDGTRLYFTIALDTGAIPAEVSVKGGEVAQIHVALPTRGITLVGISPDGAEVLAETYNGYEVESPQWIVPVTGGSPRRLDDLTAHDAAWSPDKQLVAFAQGDGLFLLDSNNGRRKIFTSRGAVLWPRWSPDGKRLRFTVEIPRICRVNCGRFAQMEQAHALCCRDGTNRPLNAAASGRTTAGTTCSRLALLPMWTFGA